MLRKAGQLGDGLAVRRLDRLHGQKRLVGWGCRGKPRTLRISGIAAGGTARHGLLAARDGVNQLVRRRAAGRVLSRDGIVSINAPRHASCGERLADALVAFAQRYCVRVQTVGVDHAPLAGAEQPSHQAFLAAQLLPGLVQQDGKLSVGLNDALGRRQDGALMPGFDDHLAPCPVAKTDGPAVSIGQRGRGLFCGADKGNRDRLPAGCAQGVTDHRLDFLTRSDPQGQDGITTPQAPDEPGPDKKLETGRARFAGRLAQGLKEQLRHPHGKLQRRFEPRVRF